MCKKIFLLIVPLLFLAFAPKVSFSQCGPQLLTNAAEKIDDYTYVKDFKVRLKKARRRQPTPYLKNTIILNKGTRYRIFVANAEEYDGELIFELYDRENIITSNFDNQTEKYYDGIEYDCMRTGAYTLVMYFSGGHEGCAAVIVAFEGNDVKRQRLADQKRF